jgi:two-component system, NarL family, invasion response regulator UvrY
MYRILLVDDHAVVRKGMRAILEDGLEGVTVCEADSGEAALTALAHDAAPGHFDAVVLDLSMPGRSGIDLLAELKHRHPRLPVLIMSLHSEEQFAVRALQAGASGYLSKAAAPEQLLGAVVKVARGGRYISEALAERLAADVGGKRGAGPPHERLSDREFEVMRAIASGRSVSEIAEIMHLSVKTVSTYRTRLLEKMGMSTNAELTRYALQQGLV